MISSVNILYVFYVRLSKSMHGLTIRETHDSNKYKVELVDAEVSCQDHELPEKCKQYVIII